jgi:carbonic anhydrase
MEKILEGLAHFQQNFYPKHRDLFEKLALGQRPQALFITCADSRIDPCLLTQTNPGELFICRVIGNIIPPYPSLVGGVAATIEYAVGVLGVPHVIVCGHTDCGVMKGVVHPEPLRPLSSLSQWLNYAEPARRAVTGQSPELTGPAFMLALAERNVVEQLQNLRTHPAVKARLENGDVTLHGWFYDIGDGVVTAYDAAQDRFVPLRASKASPLEKLNVDPANTAKSRLAQP